MLTLDHIFVFVRDPVLAAQQATAAGLNLTHQRKHHGQGTENRCFGFDNAYIELLWCTDAAEIASEPVARTGLAPRSLWWETGACPFGLCLRAQPPPIPTWTYHVPFPPGMSVEMAATSARAQEPLLFFFPPGGPSPDLGRQSLGARITALELAFPVPPQRSEAMRLIESHPHVSVVEAAQPWLTLTLDGAPTGRSVEVPAARLTLRR